MKNRLIRRVVSATVLASLIAIAAKPLPDAAYAAAPRLDTIRVALALEEGKLKSTMPAVNLSSDNGLALTLQMAAGGYPWPADSAVPAAITVAADQFQVKLLETGDIAKARALKDQIALQNGAVYIIATQRAGKPFYQVTAGGYSTQEAAASALAAFSFQPAVAALAEKPSLAGPLHWSSGNFNTMSEAEKQSASLAIAGIDASLALTEKAGGGLQISVWIGAEADNAGLQAVKANALKVMPSLQLTAVDSAKPYVLVKRDAAANADISGPANLMIISPQGLKLQATAQNQDAEVTVREKFNRTYRGAVEVTLHNGKLAVINELPFEQYLYSVVSGEMGKGWPLEALKAQAVAARTYALNSGVKYRIAHVSDTTLDQFYSGNEDTDSIQAVDATAHEVLLGKDGKLITALFSSNSGGMSSNGADVWGTALPFLKTAPSPDEGAAKNKAIWRRVALPDGRAAYVHSDYLKDTGERNPAGLPIYQLTDQGVNARAEPYVDNVKNPPLTKLNTGDRVVVFGEARESNAYSWIRGPYTPEELVELMNKVLSEPVSAPLKNLSVTKRGESARVTEMTANGKIVKVSSPDAHRSVFGGLPSTRFEIERSGGYTIQGANGASEASSGGTLYALSGSGQAQAIDTSRYYVLSGAGKVSYGSKETQYTFTGTGFGHGLGMSQWGARGLSELGYDYKKILSYYYEGVTLTKE